MTKEVNYVFQIGKWKVVKKEPGDFCLSLPWKTTTGSVCSDHKTKEEAIEAAKDSNQRDIEQKEYEIRQYEIREKRENRIIENELLVSIFETRYPKLIQSIREEFTKKEKSSS